MKDWDVFIPTVHLRWRKIIGSPSREDEEFAVRAVSWPEQSEWMVLEQAWVNIYTGEISYRNIPTIK